MYKEKRQHKRPPFFAVIRHEEVFYDEVGSTLLYKAAAWERGGSCSVRGQGMVGNIFRADVFLLTISIDVFIINMTSLIM